MCRNGTVLQLMTNAALTPAETDLTLKMLGLTPPQKKKKNWGQGVNDP